MEVNGDSSLLAFQSSNGLDVGAAGFGPLCMREVLNLLHHVMKGRAPLGKPLEAANAFIKYRIV